MGGAGRLRGRYRDGTGRSGRGIGSAVTSWLMQQAGDVALWHLHPDDDAAARIYRRPGVTEVDGFDLYVDN